MALELRAMVPVKTLAGVFVEGEGGGVAVADGGSVDFGDGDEDAELVDGGEVEELARAGAAVRPALMSAPMSVLRAVMMPSKGA